VLLLSVDSIKTYSSRETPSHVPTILQVGNLLIWHTRQSLARAITF